MIDTNQIEQAANTAAVVKQEVTAWWPTILIVGAFVAREICKVNGWLEYVCGKIIAHGGIGYLIVKLFWNPPLARGNATAGAETIHDN